MPKERESEINVKEVVDKALKRLVVKYFNSGVRGIVDIIMGVPVVYKPGDFVAYTDGKKIVVGDDIKEFFEEYEDPIEEIGAVLLHEACHVLFGDVEMYQKLQKHGVSGVVINVVFDQWINNPLRNDGYQSPLDWSDWIEQNLGESPWYKYDKITTAILIDARLKKLGKDPEETIRPIGRKIIVGGKGKGGFDPSDIIDEPIEGGEVVYGGDESKAKRAKEIAKRVYGEGKQPKDSYRESVSKGVGVGGGPEGAVTLEMLWDTSEWSRRIVDFLISSIQSSITRTWARRHRKFPGLFPGRTRTLGEPYVIALIDTSGSMSDIELAKAVSAIHYIANNTGAVGFVVYWSSGEGEDCYKIMPITDLIRAVQEGIIRNIPRGGTEIRCAYEGLKRVIETGTPDTVNVVFISDFEVFDPEYLNDIRKYSTVLLGVTTTGKVVRGEIFDGIINVRE